MRKILLFILFTAGFLFTCGFKFDQANLGYIYLGEVGEPVYVTDHMEEKTVCEILYKGEKVLIDKANIKMLYDMVEDDMQREYSAAVLMHYNENNNIILVGDSRTQHSCNQNKYWSDEISWISGSGGDINWLKDFALPLIVSEKSKNKLVFEMGINDLLHGKTGKEAAQEYAQIYNMFAGTGLYEVVVLLNGDATEDEVELNNSIREFNAVLPELLDERIVYYDMNSLLANVETGFEDDVHYDEDTNRKIIQWEMTDLLGFEPQELVTLEKEYNIRLEKRRLHELEKEKMKTDESKIPTN